MGGMDQVPDFSAGFFSLTRLAGLLQDPGVVLLRRMLPRELLGRWLPAFEQAYREADAQIAAGTISEEDWRNFYQYGHVDPDLIPNLQSWFQDLLKQQPLRHVLRTALGPQAALLLNYSLARRQMPAHPERAIDYHQDREFLGPLTKAVNVWIPLTPAGGGDWPGLELWLGGPQHPVFEFTMPPAERTGIGAAIPPDSLWRPALQPGDVLIFTHYTIHRSIIPPTATQTRFSFELRLSADTDTTLTPSLMIPISL